MTQDRGLQPERTSLAFVRTSLSILGLALVCLRWSWPIGVTGLVALIVSVLLAAGVTVCEWMSRPRTSARFVRGTATPAVALNAALVVSLLLLAASGWWILVR